MSALKSLDPRPITRLLVGWGGWLGLGHATLWALGLGWAAIVLRYGSGLSPQTGAELGAALGTVALVALPAALASFVAECGRELRRVRAISLLPGLWRRFRGAALSLGLAASCLAAASLGALLPAHSFGAALGLAALGYAAGLWLLARPAGHSAWLVGSAAFVAALVAALHFAPHAQDAPLAGPGLALFALAACWLRLHPALLRATWHDGPTLLSPTSEHTSFARGCIAGAPALLPPPRLGGSVAGWIAARDFEQRAERSGRSARSMSGILAVAVVLLPLLSAGLGALLRVDFDPGDGLRGVAAHLAGALLAPAGGAGHGASPRAHFALLLAACGASALLAFYACAPLLGSFLYPLSRSMRARLVLRVFFSTILRFAASALVLGLAAGALLQLLSGRAFEARVPALVWALLAGLLVAPWIQLLVHAGARLADRQGEKYALAPLVLPGILLIGLLMVADELWPLIAGVPLGPIFVGYAILLAASLWILSSFLQRHYRSADLVRR